MYLSLWYGVEIDTKDNVGNENKKSYCSNLQNNLKSVQLHDLVGRCCTVVGSVNIKISNFSTCRITCSLKCCNNLETGASVELHITEVCYIHVYINSLLV